MADGNVQIFFPGEDSLERGLIEWNGASWEVFVHESFARGWEDASSYHYYRENGMKALLDCYALSKTEVLGKDVLHLSPAELERLSRR
jgi:hypothetical protein